MSLFTHFKTWFTSLETWWEGTTIGQQVDAAAKAAILELEALATSDLATITEHTAAAILPVLASGGSLSAVMATGIAAAETAFAAAGAGIAANTVATFVSTLHGTVVATMPAPASTPAAAPAIVS